MRSFVIAAAVVLVAPGVLSAQVAPAPAAAPAGGYSTADTELGTLIDNPDTKAVLVKYIPAMIASEQISMARGMTLKGLQQYAAEQLPDATLTRIDADLAKVPVKK